MYSILVPISEVDFFLFCGFITFYKLFDINCLNKSTFICLFQSAGKSEKWWYVLLWIWFWLSTILYLLKSELKVFLSYIYLSILQKKCTSSFILWTCWLNCSESFREHSLQGAQSACAAQAHPRHSQTLILRGIFT